MKSVLPSPTKSLPPTSGKQKFTFLASFSVSLRARVETGVQTNGNNHHISKDKNTRDTDTSKFFLEAEFTYVISWKLSPRRVQSFGCPDGQQQPYDLPEFTSPTYWPMAT